MPELPEVENFKLILDSRCIKKTITGVGIPAPSLIKGVKPEVFKRELTGKKIISTLRHGKYLTAEYEKGKHLIFHFGMTGKLNSRPAGDELTRHTRVYISFNDRTVLEYINVRKFGAVSLISGIEDFIKEKKLGVDPLNSKINFKLFRSLTVSGGNIKGFLMNQKKIAGIGNIYSDEILYLSGMHPSSSIGRISDIELKKVYMNMIFILKESIKAIQKKGRLPDSYLAEHRNKGSACPLCGGLILQEKIAGRSSYFCSRHQKKV